MLKSSLKRYGFTLSPHCEVREQTVYIFAAGVVLVGSLAQWSRSPTALFFSRMFEPRERPKRFKSTILSLVSLRANCLYFSRVRSTCRAVGSAVQGVDFSLFGRVFKPESRPIFSVLWDPFPALEKCYILLYVRVRCPCNFRKARRAWKCADARSERATKKKRYRQSGPLALGTRAHIPSGHIVNTL